MLFQNLIFLSQGTEPVTAERIEKALLNTIMGITIVFLVLIAISLIISLFKYIAKAENRVANNQSDIKTTASETAVNVPDIIETTQDAAELSDDSELVAVITAAIYAYEASQGNLYVPADGLVVRSIRKKSRSNWQNA